MKLNESPFLPWEEGVGDGGLRLSNRRLSFRVKQLPLPPLGGRGWGWRASAIQSSAQLSGQANAPSFLGRKGLGMEGFGYPIVGSAFGSSKCPFLPWEEGVGDGGSAGITNP